MRTYRESEGASGAGAAEFVSAELVAPDHGIDAGWRRASREPSLADVFGSIKTRPTGPMWKKLIAFLGPGYLVAVGYMDPGNWATSLAGGSKFGYALLSIALLSNIMAIILQALCARLGIGSGRDLAQACRDAFPRWVVLAALGAGRDRHLRHRPRRGDRHGDRPQSPVRHPARDRRDPDRARRVPDPLACSGSASARSRPSSSRCSAVIAVCFGIQIAMADPDWGQVIRGFAPTVEIVKNPAMLYLALGIIGATVMPHNLYLHSGIVQTRAYGRRAAGEARGDQARHHRFDHRADVRAAHQRLDPDPRGRHLPQGRARPTWPSSARCIRSWRRCSARRSRRRCSRIALLCCGLNSTVTATLAGQIVMEGFLDIRLPPWLRRLVTRAIAIVPAAIVTIW